MAIEPSTHVLVERDLLWSLSRFADRTGAGGEWERLQPLLARKDGLGGVTLKGDLAPPSLPPCLRGEDDGW